VPHRLRQCARGPRRVLEDGEVIGGGRRLVGHRQTLEPPGEIAIDGEHADVREGRLPRRGITLDQQHPRLAVVEAQRHAVGTEQREERDGDRATLHGAEQRAVERQGRLQHDRDAVAALDAFTLEEVSEARRPGDQRIEVVLLAPAVGELQAERRATTGVAVDTLVADVETPAVAVEPPPQRIQLKVASASR